MYIATDINTDIYIEVCHPGVYLTCPVPVLPWQLSPVQWGQTPPTSYQPHPSPLPLPPPHSLPLPLPHSLLLLPQYPRGYTIIL